MEFQFRVFSDHICPYCYIGKGIVDQLKQEFSITDEWVPLELHPQTPQEGTPLTEKFPGFDLNAMFTGLQQAAAPYGIEMNPVSLLANSHLALQATEYAREHGKFHELHEAIFRANFTDGKNIGDLDLLLQLATDVGLNAEELRTALQDGTYAQRLEEAQAEAQRYGISSTPTFIINGRYKLVGARPLESFRTALQQIAADTSTK